MTGGLEGARCAGRWWLFDSTDRRDHIAARQLCANCPAIDGCRELLQAALTAPCVQAGSGPIGTWAGLLFGRPGQNPGRRKSKPREHGSQRGYDQHRHLSERPCSTCMAAHYEVLEERFGVLNGS